MRFFLTRALLSLSLLAPIFASPETKLEKSTVEDVLSESKGGPADAGAKAGATNSEAVSDLNTVFNGEEVPPMKELNGDDFDKDTSRGYWYGTSSGYASRPFRLTNSFIAGSSSITPLTVTTAKQ